MISDQDQVLREEGKDRDDQKEMMTDHSYRRTPTPEAIILFVDKLTPNVNDKHLSEIFGTYGKIEKVISLFFLDLCFSLDLSFEMSQTK